MTFNRQGDLSFRRDVERNTLQTGIAVNDLITRLDDTGFISPEGFGAKGDGVTDDTLSLQAAIDAAAGQSFRAVNTYLITAALVLPSESTLVLDGATITQATAGLHIMEAVSATNIRVLGGTFVGAGSSTTPASGVGIYGPGATALISLMTCTNVEVTGVECSDFYSGIAVVGCTRANVHQNYVHNWYLYAVLASESVDFQVESNWLVGCDQAGAGNGYGVAATGDAAAGRTQRNGSISGNTIRDIPSWDGIMSHDCDGLRIVGNDIRNVRTGIDIGHVNATNVIANVLVADNYIEATTTNTWGASIAIHNGIGINGYSASVLPTNVVVHNNTVSGFYGTAGWSYTGNLGSIAIQSADALIGGNCVHNQGNIVELAASVPGIYAIDQSGQLSIISNRFHGYAHSGGVRLANVLATAVTITGNVIHQLVTTDLGIYITGSTIPSIAIGHNATNAVEPLGHDASTLGSSVETLTGTTDGTIAVYRDVLNIARGGAGLADLQIATPSGQLRVIDDTYSTALFRVYGATGNVQSYGALLTSNGAAQWSSGTGDPESVVTATPGSLWSRTDGGASTTLYVKESGSGNTGWIAK